MSPILAFLTVWNIIDTDVKNKIESKLLSIWYEILPLIKISMSDILKKCMTTGNATSRIFKTFGTELIFGRILRKYLAQEKLINLINQKNQWYSDQHMAWKCKRTKIFPINKYFKSLLWHVLFTSCFPFSLAFFFLNGLEGKKRSEIQN